MNEQDMVKEMAQQVGQQFKAAVLMGMLEGAREVSRALYGSLTRAEDAQQQEQLARLDSLLEQEKAAREALDAEQDPRRRKLLQARLDLITRRAASQLGEPTPAPLQVEHRPSQQEPPLPSAQESVANGAAAEQPVPAVDRVNDYTGGRRKAARNGTHS